MPRLRTGDDGTLDPIVDTRSGPDPYVSNDRADLYRIVQLSENVRKELGYCPSNGKVTVMQFLRLRDEVSALLSLTRRVKDRLDAS